MNRKRIVVSTLIAAAMLVTLRAAAESGPVPTDPNAITPIRAGQPLPDIVLKAPDGTPFDLNASVARKPTVLVFFRGGWCPYCNAHLGALQTIEPELVKLGYQVIAVSPDRPEIIEAPVEKNGLTYALYSDQDMTASRALGIAFRIDDQTYETYKGYGIDLEKDSGRTHRMLPVPAALVIDTKGVVRYAYTNADYKVRVEPDVLLAKAKAAVE